MNFVFTEKKMSPSDDLRAYAQKKISKLEKYFRDEPEATVTFSVEKKNRCIVEVMLYGANGTLFRAVTEDADGDMRGAIDAASARYFSAVARSPRISAISAYEASAMIDLIERFALCARCPAKSSVQSWLPGS